MRDLKVDSGRRGWWARVAQCSRLVQGISNATPGWIRENGALEKRLSIRVISARRVAAFLRHEREAMQSWELETFIDGSEWQWKG